MADKPNLWDQLAEVSGWDRTAAKRSIYQTISGRVPEPADESLWETFCDLLKAEPAGLSIMLGQGIRH